jgi:hypothetical protein
MNRQRARHAVITDAVVGDRDYPSKFQHGARMKPSEMPNFCFRSLLDCRCEDDFKPITDTPGSSRNSLWTVLSSRDQAAAVSLTV